MEDAATWSRSKRRSEKEMILFVSIDIIKQGMLLLCLSLATTTVW